MVEENLASLTEAEGYAIALNKVDAIVDGFFRILPNLLIGLIFFVLILLVAKLIKHIVRHAALRRRRPDLGNVLGTLLQWIVGMVGFLLAVTIIVPGVGIANLMTTLGITSVAIGFAFKDILQNLLAGILILLRHPFRRGDQIVTAGYEGTVESIETRATLIRTYDGRLALIPNSEIYTASVLINTAFDKRRSEYDVGVGYDQDIDHVIETIIRALHGVEGVLREPAPEAFAVEFAQWTMNIRIWWWTAPDQRSVLLTQGRVLRALKAAFVREDIELPFPVNTVLFHDETEKIGQEGN